MGNFSQPICSWAGCMGGFFHVIDKTISAKDLVESVIEKKNLVQSMLSQKSEVEFEIKDFNVRCIMHYFKLEITAA